MVTRRPKRKLVVVAVTVLSAGLLCAYVSAQYGTTYEPGDPPIVGEISHIAPMDPPPNTRTNVGVKEPVELSISSFVDWDIQVTPSGQFPVQDTMGDVVWTSDPGNCEFWPVRGSSTQFVGGYFAFDLAENIMSEVWDSRKMGLDPPVYRTLQLVVKVPNGNVPFWLGPDAKLGFDGPPNNSMGVQTAFAVQVQPNDVNFAQLDLAERIAPNQQFPWPDDTAQNPSKYTVPEWWGTFRPTSMIVNNQVMHNMFQDSVSTLGPWNISHLRNPITQQNQDATFNVLQRLYFMTSDQPVTWKLYQTPTHPRWFRAADFTAKVGWQGNGNAETKDARGPYMQQGQ